jgi:hypothetical protein
MGADSELKLRRILEAEVPGIMYEVTVGNIGRVYFGEDKSKAQAAFAKYVRMSNQGYGSVGHEPVTILFDGKVIEQHVWSKP